MFAPSASAGSYQVSSCRDKLESDNAMQVLQNAVHPRLLRRLKSDVLGKSSKKQDSSSTVDTKTTKTTTTTTQAQTSTTSTATAAATTTTTTTDTSSTTNTATTTIGSQLDQSSLQDDAQLNQQMKLDSRSSGVKREALLDSDVQSTSVTATTKRRRRASAIAAANALGDSFGAGNDDDDDDVNISEDDEDDVDALLQNDKSIPQSISDNSDSNDARGSFKGRRVEVVRLTMSEEEARLYNWMAKRTTARVEFLANNNMLGRQFSNVLEMLLRLRQVEYLLFFFSLKKKGQQTIYFIHNINEFNFSIQTNSILFYS